jgi:hypothetical protein
VTARIIVLLLCNDCDAQLMVNISSGSIRENVDRARTHAAKQRNWRTNSIIRHSGREKTQDYCPKHANARGLL